MGSRGARRERDAASPPPPIPLTLLWMNFQAKLIR